MARMGLLVVCESIVHLKKMHSTRLTRCARRHRTASFMPAQHFLAFNSRLRQLPSFCFWPEKIPSRASCSHFHSCCNQQKTVNHFQNLRHFLHHSTPHDGQQPHDEHPRHVGPFGRLAIQSRSQVERVLWPPKNAIKKWVVFSMILKRRNQRRFYGRALNSWDPSAVCGMQKAHCISIKIRNEKVHRASTHQSSLGQSVCPKI